MTLLIWCVCRRSPVLDEAYHGYRRWPGRAFLADGYAPRAEGVPLVSWIAGCDVDCAFPRYCASVASILTACHFARSPSLALTACCLLGCSIACCSSAARGGQWHSWWSSICGTADCWKTGPRSLEKEFAGTSNLVRFWAKCMHLYASHWLGIRQLALHHANAARNTMLKATPSAVAAAELVRRKRRLQRRCHLFHTRSSKAHAS